MINLDSTIPMQDIQEVIRRLEYGGGQSMDLDHEMSCIVAKNLYEHRAQNIE